jgi:uncharacterized protein YdeI (YjbR/CyaY-like superfamily)
MATTTQSADTKKKTTKKKATKKSAVAADRPRVVVDQRSELRAWLAEHHEHENGVWVVTRKKNAGGTVSWNDIVEEALCVGWIDSLPRAIDEQQSMLLLTPRRPGSKWSAKNKAHVDVLRERGLLRPAGLTAIARAQADGTWEALDAVSRLEMPVDLAAALAALVGAREFWDAFPPSARRGILEWIDAARRPETRAARIDQTARGAARNERALQWPPKPTPP